MTFVERLVVAAACQVHHEVELEPGALLTAVCRIMARGASWERTTLDLSPLIRALKAPIRGEGK